MIHFIKRYEWWRVRGERRFGWTSIKYPRPEPNTRIITVGNLQAVFICYRSPNCGSRTRLGNKKELNEFAVLKFAHWKKRVNYGRRR
jgi:hypothetical protein